MRLLSLFAIVACAACSGGAASVNPAALPNDLGLAAGDGASPSIGDGATPAADLQIALPTHCPCPLESYCELTTDHCVAGCVADDQCGVGRFCEKTGRTCQPGCRSAADCSPDPNGTASCKAGTCIYACDGDLHFCGGACRADAPTACGQSCTPCSAPAHGQATCAAGQCGFRCDTGFAPSGGACVPGVDCYRDLDGDHVPGQTTVQQVPGTTCPSGWTSAPSGGKFDCDDLDPQTFPGQTMTFASSKDYDCNGQIDHFYPATCCHYGPQQEIICNTCGLSVVADCTSTPVTSCTSVVPIKDQPCGTTYDSAPGCTVVGGACKPGGTFSMTSIAVMCR
jgi:hypothetical protein